MTFLASAVAFLTALVLVDLLLSFGIIRRLRELQLRTGEGPANAEVGMRIGPFTAIDSNGEPISDDQLQTGPTLVTFLSVGCEPCEAVKRDLLSNPPSIDTIFFVEGKTKSEAETYWVGVEEIGRVAWVTYEGPVMEAFKIQGYPSLIVVENGLVSASGIRVRDLHLDEHAAVVG
jgi:hypothetical protein